MSPCARLLDGMFYPFVSPGCGGSVAALASPICLVIEEPSRCRHGARVAWIDILEAVMLFEIDVRRDDDSINAVQSGDDAAVIGIVRRTSSRHGIGKQEAHHAREDEV